MMKTLILTRQPADGKSVRGLLTLPGGDTLSTLENADYLIPTGTYPLCVTMSARFKRPLPLVCNVVGAPSEPTRQRAGIRFHRGAVPEHSKGCILLRTTAEVDALTALLQGHPNTLIIK